MIDPDASSSRLPSPLDGICSPYKIKSFTHAASSTVRPPTSSPPGHGVAKAKRRPSTRIRPRIPMFAGECPSSDADVPIPSVSGMPSTEVVNARAGSSRHRSLSQPTEAAAVAAKETMESWATVPNKNASAQRFQHWPPKRLNLDYSLRGVGNICASAPSAGSATGHTSKPSSSLHTAPARSEPRRGSHIDRCSSAAVASPSSTSPASSTWSLNEKSAEARKKMPASIELGQRRVDSCGTLSGEQQSRAERIRRKRKSASCVGDQTLTPASIGTTSDGNTSREDQRLFDSGNDSSDNDEVIPPPPAGSPPSLILPDSPRGGTMNPISPFAPFKSPKCASLQYNPAPPYTPGAPLPLAAWLEPAPATAGASAARAYPGTRALPAERSTPSPPPSSAGIGRGRCNSSSSNHTPASATTTIADEDNDSVNYSGTEDWHHYNDADDEASCQSSSHWSVGSSSSSSSSGSFFSPQLVAQLQKHKLYDHICLRTLRLVNVGTLEELSNVPVTDLMAGGFNKIQARKLSDIATTAEAVPTAAAKGDSNSEKKASTAKAFLLSAVEKDGVPLNAGKKNESLQTATVTASDDSPPSHPLPLGVATATALPNKPAGAIITTNHRKRHTKQRRTRKKQPKEDSHNEEAVITQQRVFVVVSTLVPKKTSPNVNQHPRLHKSSSADDVLVSSSSSCSISSSNTSPFSTSSSGSSPDHNVAPSSRALLSSLKTKGRELKGTAPMHSTTYQMMRGWRYAHVGSKPSPDDRGGAPPARAGSGATRTHPNRPSRSRSADDALASSFETAAAAATSPADDRSSSWRQRVSTQTKGFGIHREARITTPRPCASPLRTFEVSPVSCKAIVGSQLRGEDDAEKYDSGKGTAASGGSEIIYVKDAPGEAVPVPIRGDRERKPSAFDDSSSSSSSSRWFSRSRAILSRCYRLTSCSNRTTVERSVKSPPTPPPTPPSTPPRSKGASGTGGH